MLELLIELSLRSHPVPVWWVNQRTGRMRTIVALEARGLVEGAGGGFQLTSTGRIAGGALRAQRAEWASAGLREMVESIGKHRVDLVRSPYFNAMYFGGRFLRRFPDREWSGVELALAELARFGLVAWRHETQARFPGPSLDEMELVESRRLWGKDAGGTPATPGVAAGSRNTTQDSALRTQNSGLVRDPLTPALSPKGRGGKSALRAGGRA